MSVTRMAVLVLPFRRIRNPNNEDDEVGDGYQEPEQMGRAKGLALRGVRVERGVSGELIPRQCYICVAIGLVFVSVLHLCSNCTLPRVLLFCSFLSLSLISMGKACADKFSA